MGRWPRHPPEPRVIMGCVWEGTGGGSDCRDVTVEAETGGGLGGRRTGPPAERGRRPLEAGQGPEMGFSLEPPEGVDASVLARKTHFGFDPRSCVIINLSHSKLRNSW